jgi:hypothetical protein
MLRFFDFQVNLSTDQGRIKEIEITARMTGKPEGVGSSVVLLPRNAPGSSDSSDGGNPETR